MFNLTSVINSVKTVLGNTPNLATMCQEYMTAADPYRTLKENTSAEAADAMPLILGDPELQRELLNLSFGGEAASKLWTKDGISFVQQNGKVVAQRGKGGFAVANPISAAVFLIDMLYNFHNLEEVIAPPAITLPLGVIKGTEQSTLVLNAIARTGGKTPKLFDRHSVKDVINCFIKECGAKTLQQVAEQADHSHQPLIKGGARKTDPVEQAYYTAALAMKHEGYNFLLANSSKPYAEAFLQKMGCEWPANLLVDSPEAQCATHFVISTELLGYVSLLVAAVKSTSFVINKVEENLHEVSIGGVSFFINKLGVFDARGRRLNGMAVAADDKPISLTNSFGAFLELLLSLACDLNVSQQKVLSQYARAIAKKGQWDSEEESGGQDTGDRAWYNFYATAVYTRGYSPWRIFGGKVTACPSFLLPYFGDASLTDEVMLKKFNMARMHKGKCPYVNAILMNLRLDFVPERFQVEVLTALVFTANGLPLAEGLRKLFPDFSWMDDHQLVEHCRNNVAVSLSTKVAKVMKRVGLVFAKQAEPLASAHTSVEPRAFRLDGQGDIFGFSPVHVRTVVFAERGIYPPGLSVTMDPAQRPLIANKRSETEVLPLFNKSAGGFGPMVEGFVKTDLIGSTVYSYAHLEQEVAGHVATGVFVEANEPVFAVPYENNDGLTMNCWQTMPQGGMLTAVKTAVNEYGELTIRIEYATLENEFKWRSNVKTMVVGCYTGLGMVYNNLNKNLPAGLQDVIMADAIKSKDLVQRNLDIVFQTVRALPSGNKLVQLFNKVVGIDNNVGLSFNALAAAMGLYDGIIKEFEREYGRAIWLYTRSDESLWTALKERYTNLVGDGWYTVEPKSLREEFPTDAVILSNGDVNKDTTDILVFYKLKEGEGPEYVFYQRTFALVGVKLGVKTEISTVAQAAGTTRTMAAVARTIATGMCGVKGDPSAAVRIMADGGKVTEKFVALHACDKHIPFKVNVEGDSFEPLKINVFDGDKLSAEFLEVLGELSPEVVEAASNGQLSLDSIVEELGCFTFDLGGELPWLFLPSIASLDHSGMSRATLGGATRALFEYAINKVGVIELKKLTLKVGSMLHAFVANDCFTKQLQQGRLAAQAKAVGVPGIPVHELWVVRTGSEYPNSFYNHLRTAFRAQGINEIDGQKVALSRSPLPFPAFLQVKVIEQDSWQSFGVTPHTFGVNALAAYISAGDFDGR